MSKLRKIGQIIERSLIFKLDGIDNKRYTDIYWKYLQGLGVNFTGRPNYISSSAYLDGQGYELITIGKDVVISREAMLLTHDYSVETALHSIGLGTDDRRIKTNEGITIGDNSFIGARVSLLPGTHIGRDCIIGACSVVKGDVPDGSVLIGVPPRRIIAATEDLGMRFAKDLDGEQLLSRSTE